MDSLFEAQGESQSIQLHSDLDKKLVVIEIRKIKGRRNATSF